MRYYERLGESGLRYLLDKGAVYSNAHHAHANTETIVRHTTLATGADPAVHGMIGNVWLDLVHAERLIRNGFTPITVVLTFRRLNARIA